MATLISQIKECIEQKLGGGGKKKFIIFPFGDVGMQVKEVLRNAYGINAEYVLDNNLCKYNPDIKPLDFLDNISCDQFCVILASTNPDIYGELKKELQKYFSDKNIAELSSMVRSALDNKGNKIVGHLPKVINSSINFIGENNILYCDENVCLNGSELFFRGSNSLIYLGTGEHKVYIDLHNDSVCHIGRFTKSSNRLSLIITEHKHCFIGDNCLISHDVMIRNADAHLIYSCDDGSRINPTKSVYIGDHVWIGQYAKILKGAQIDSGSIIGTSSIIAGKIIPHNSIWAGNPSKQIKNKVFWDRTLVHSFTEEMTESSMNYDKFISKNRGGFSADFWIYEYDENQVIEWDNIESAKSYGTALEKCKFLLELNTAKAKNRFVHK